MEKIESKKQEVVRVALYLRVSTEEQSKTGYGLEYQEHDLKKLVDYRSTLDPKWITKDEWIFVDGGFSGGDLNRPAFKKMMEKARNKEFDLVAVWKIDRLSRNLTHLLKTFEELKDYGVSFFSLKENIDFSGAIGKLTFQIFGALSEFERNMIKTRTTEGKMASARSGNYIGNGIPYGYDKVKNPSGKGSQLKKIDEEVKIVKNIFNWYAYNDLSFLEIARKLNKLKITKGKNAKKNAVNTDWQSTTIKRMLTNFSYCGYRTESFKQEDGSIVYIDVPVDKIINEELFRFIQIKIEEGEQSGFTKTSDKEQQYLLSGKIMDIDTQKYLYGMIRSKDNKLTYRRDKYTTKEGKTFPNIEFLGSILDDYVWDNIVKVINDPEKYHEEYLLETEKGGNIAEIKEELDIINQSITSELKFQDNADKDYYKGGISEEKRDKYLEESELKIKQLKKDEEKVQKKLNDIAKIKIGLDILKKISNQYIGKINNLTFIEKRKIINILVEKILVKKIFTKEVEDLNNINKNSQNSIKVDIFFRFKVENDEKNIDLPQLSNPINNQKNIPKDAGSCVNGRKRETRTRNPTLPKRVR